MKKRIDFKKSLMIIVMVVCLISIHSLNVVHALSIGRSGNVIKAIEGAGTIDNPYLISSDEEYNEIAQEVIDGNDYSGKYFKLTADIGSQENPITLALGTYSNVFSGNLDGDGHTIYVDLNYDRGLINKTGRNVTIKNLTIEGNVKFLTGNNKYVAAFVGSLYPGSTIDNCINKATINSGGVAGGIVGYIYNSTISNCVNYGDVQGVTATSAAEDSGNGTGGIVGAIDAANPSTITGCTNFGDVTSTNQVGGIVGKARANAGTIITNCTNGSETISPTITATDSNAANTGVAGGIVGMSAVNISNSTNYGSVVGTKQAGGIVGYTFSSTISNCVNNGAVEGASAYSTATDDGYGVGGIVGTIDHNNPTTITGCTNLGNITSTNQAGGIVGKARANVGTLITNCINGSKTIKPTVIANDSSAARTGVAGGIVGMSAVSVTNSINYGTVNGTNQIGGIVGALIDNVSVDSCENFGTIDASNYIGGIIGYAYTAVGEGCITNCIQRGNNVTKTSTKYPNNLVGLNPWIGWISGTKGSTGTTITDTDSANLHVSMNLSGFGSEEQPYLIDDVVDYNELATRAIADTAETGAWYKLTADIGDKDNPVTLMLGTTSNTFKGNIDGNGHTIYVHFESDTITRLGLIPVADNNLIIKNLIVDGEITSTSSNGYAGGIASVIYSGTIIDNCINKADITGTNYSTGGIVGFAYGNTITNCKNYGKIEGSSGYTKDVSSGHGVGGIVGTINHNNPTTITGCTNLGNITSTNQAGGIAGKARTNADTLITNCINGSETIKPTIKVTDSSSNNGVAGGIVGMSGVSVTNSINYGTIDGTSQAGGIVGALISDVSVDSCENYGDVNASKNHAGGIIGWSYEAVKANKITNCVHHEGSVTKASSTNATGLVASPTYVGWIIGRESTSGATVVSGENRCMSLVQMAGVGSESRPFVISNLVDYNNFADSVVGGENFGDKYVILSNNIGSLNNPVTNIIGNASNYFAGTFDGTNHTLYLNINLNSGVDTGAFSGIAGIVKNLVIDGSIVNQANNSRVGGVAGRIISGHIENCVNKANVLGNYYVGGIAGLSDVEPSYILNCSNYGDISGAKFVGGITGYYQAIGDQINTYTVKEYINSDEYNEVLYDCTEKYASIINCVNYGTIRADGEAYVGGIAGVITKTKNADTDSGSTVIGCLNYGEVQGTNNVSGIVGWAYNNTPEAGVDYCYNFTPDIKIGEAVASKIKVAASATVSDSHLAYIACYGQTNDIGSNVNNFVNYEISINSASATISADGSLILNVYSIPKDNIDTETAYVKVNDVSTLVKDLEVDNKGRFVVSTPDLEPVYMTNDFSIQYFDANNNPLSREVTMSIQDYLMNFYNGNDAGLKSLAKSMLNYGSYCQLLFNINTDNLANSTLVEAEKDVSSVVANIDDIKTNGGQTEGATPLGFSLVLNNKTDLKLYLNIDGDINEYKAYIDDEEVELVHGSGNQYFVRINNVAAPKLNEKHNITLTHNETGDLYINCSLLSYAYSVINKAETTYANNQNLVNAMRAMYAYHNSARDLLN